MITDHYRYKVKDNDLEGMWFQQDGTTCHTASNVRCLAQKDNQGNVTWPLRSCDLMAVDIFVESTKQLCLYQQTRKAEALPAKYESR